MIAQLLPALLRTVVPLIYGLLIQWGLGNYLPDQGLTWVATVAILVAVYLVLRILERYKRWIGILLGWIGAPQYVSPAQDALDSAATAVQTQLHAETTVLLTEVAKRLAAVETQVAAHPKEVGAAVSAAINSTTARKAPVKKTTPAKKATAKKASN